MAGVGAQFQASAGVRDHVNISNGLGESIVKYHALSLNGKYEKVEIEKDESLLPSTLKPEDQYSIAFDYGKGHIRFDTCEDKTEEKPYESKKETRVKYKAVLYPIPPHKTITVQILATEFDINISSAWTTILEEEEDARKDRATMPKTGSMPGNAAKSVQGESGLQDCMINRINVVRSGREHACFVSEIKRGDIIKLAKGSIVPADAVIADVSTKQCIVVRRHSPDYFDYISNANGEFLAQNKPADLLMTVKKSAQKVKDARTLGWSAADRICYPCAIAESFVHQGSVVMFGEALAIACENATNSRWSQIWKGKIEKNTKMIRKRKDGQALDEKGTVVSPEIAWNAKMMNSGLLLKVASYTRVLVGVTFLVIEDDIRFPRTETDTVDLSDGIGIGCACDEAEFFHRYSELSVFAARAGIRICIALRSDAASADEALRLARKLKFVYCTPDEFTCDYLTAPLSAMFENTGAVVRVGSESDSIINLITALQKTQAPHMPGSINDLINKSCPNPTGVISHIHKVLQTSDFANLATIDQVEADALTLMKEAEKRRMRYIQIYAALPNSMQLVAYLGEDWGALVAAEVGITWKSSMSYGAYEARLLADGVLEHNSARRLLQVIADLKMKTMTREESKCVNCCLS